LSKQGPNESGSSLSKETEGEIIASSDAYVTLKLVEDESLLGLILQGLSTLEKEAIL